MKLFHLLFSAIITIGASCNVHAEIRETTIPYKDGATELEGILVEDTNYKGVKPGVLVIHDWMGISDDTKMRARMLAELGYVAFAADIYGKGVRPKNSAEAGKLAGSLKEDRAKMRSRAAASLAVLKSQKNVNASKIAAIGYCFGGTTALELARSGAPLIGTVSFHGGLSTPNTKAAAHIKGKILILHGADDPFVKADEVANFEEEMRAAHVDWQLVKYSDAVHAFTVKGAGTDPSKGAAYNERADLRSWEAMKVFFQEIFKA